MGRWGENLAANFLEKQGYRILARNVRTPYGEIDLVAEQHLTSEARTAMLVFVEVKTRSSTSFGPPEAAITANKREHMLASAQAYLQEYPGAIDHWRIDVIAVQRFRSGKAPQIVHFENALT